MGDLLLALVLIAVACLGAEAVRASCRRALTTPARMPSEHALAPADEPLAA